MIDVNDLFWFIDTALDRMVDILRQLGDKGANDKPDIPGANSPYAILTHCLGVMDWWGGHLIAGRDVTRDREAEFTASGPVEALIARVVLAQQQLKLDAASLVAAAPLVHLPSGSVSDLPYSKAQGAAFVHIYEELAQHLGQMELTRDCLLAMS